MGLPVWWALPLLWLGGPRAVSRDLGSPHRESLGAQCLVGRPTPTAAHGASGQEFEGRRWAASGTAPPRRSGGAAFSRERAADGPAEGHRLRVLWHAEYYRIPRRRISQHLLIARATFYGWLHRLQEGALDGEESARESGRKTPRELAQLIWDVFAANPHWGRRRLAMAIQALGAFIAASTVRNVLLRPRPRPLPAATAAHRSMALPRPSRHCVPTSPSRLTELRREGCPQSPSRPWPAACPTLPLELPRLCAALARARKAPRSHGPLACNASLRSRNRSPTTVSSALDHRKRSHGYLTGTGVPTPAYTARGSRPPA